MHAIYFLFKTYIVKAVQEQNYCRIVPFDKRKHNYRYTVNHKVSARTQPIEKCPNFVILFYPPTDSDASDSYRNIECLRHSSFSNSNNKNY